MTDVCGLCHTSLSKIMMDGGFLSHMIECHREALDGKLAEFIVSEVDL